MTFSMEAAKLFQCPNVAALSCQFSVYKLTIFLSVTKWIVLWTVFCKIVVLAIIEQNIIQIILHKSIFGGNWSFSYEVRFIFLIMAFPLGLAERVWWLCSFGIPKEKCHQRLLHRPQGGYRIENSQKCFIWFNHMHQPFFLKSFKCFFKKVTQRRRYSHCEFGNTNRAG